MRRKPKAGTQKYFDALFIKYGEKMFCPVCNARPCTEECWTGFSDEFEIAALTSLLAECDPKPKKT